MASRLQYETKQFIWMQVLFTRQRIALVLFGVA